MLQKPRLVRIVQMRDFRTICLFALATGLLAGCGASLNNEASSVALAADQKVGAASLAPASAGTPLPTLVAGDEPRVLPDKKAVPPASKRGADAVVASITPGNPGYKIGTLDVLEVSVFKVPELSKTIQVSESGAINMPLVGEVTTVGRTAQDVERELTAKLGAKYLRSPQVTVFVKEFNSQRITVEGAVKKPGIYPLRARTTLMQALAMSEGIDSATASGSVAIFRQAEAKQSDTKKDGAKQAIQYEISDIRTGKVPDPDVVASDLIVVDVSATKEAFNNFVKAIPIANVLRIVP
jgi:polysaccharide biosynthesis/export protein